MHGHDASRAANQANDPSLRTARRHEVGDVDGSGLRLVLRLQHERVRAVATPRPEASGRRQEPPPARLVTEERREARSGVEPRETEPIDRSVATH